ncbi:unnamed protein product [Rhizoctonia solani]|nr:unnamed protein product [Rhizoctonia solani]
MFIPSHYSCHGFRTGRLAHDIVGYAGAHTYYRCGKPPYVYKASSSAQCPSVSSSSLTFNPTTMYSSLLSLAALAIGVLSAPSSTHLETRAAADNTVYVTDANKYCMIMPRDPRTNIGDSEHPGGMKAYCSASGRYDNSQGKLPDNFWSNIAFKTGTSSRGARYAQLTGCIRPETLSRLNPNDGGGQYDSSGGDDGNGNPQGSVCLGYKHYVELVEPSENRACIKCCDNYDDYTSGCPAVIPGNYFNCA